MEIVDFSTLLLGDESVKVKLKLSLDFFWLNLESSDSSKRGW